MANVNKVTLKRSAYSNVSHKRDNGNIITEPVKKVTPPMGANLAELPLPFALPEHFKRRKNKLSSILSDFKEMSESLEQTVAELSHSDNFIKALRLFVNLFNADLILLLEYDQQQQTNVSDYLFLKIRSQEALLSHYGFNLSNNLILDLDPIQAKNHAPKEIIENLFSKDKLFFDIIAYFDRIAEGQSLTKPISQPKLHGLIIDRLG